MAEKQIVVFSLQKEDYGLEITAVQEIVRYQEITKLPEAPEFIKGIINLRGQVIPVIDLKQRFYNINSEITDDTRIVVVKVAGKILGLIADQVSEVLRIPEENIEATPELIKQFGQTGIYGIGKLENRLLILLDLEAALSSEELKEIEKVS